ncbi:MAG: HAMP domain-containing sensor histidine kinase [Aquabacterium sp.]
MNDLARRPPGWRLYVNVLAPSLAVVVVVGALAMSSVKVLGAVRAYVGGESLWSKARADAVQHLRTYAVNKDPMEFEQFKQALTVPLGDRVAREEMAKPQRDMALIRRSLAAGGNHPDDIDGMITLFIRFGDMAMFKDALGAWQLGDNLIARLQDRALVLKEFINKGDQIGTQVTLHDIQQLNESLRDAEVQFSASLGVASRFTERLLLASVGLSAVLLSLASLLMIRRTLRRQTEQQDAMAQANRRWELAVAGSDLGLFELDAQTRQVSIDARTAAMYGLDAQPTVLQRDEVRRFIAPEDVLPSAHAIETALKSRELVKITVRTILPDGQSRHIETTGRVLEDASSKATRLIGVVRDVTQEKARAQLAVERDAAERVAASQRAFLSRLSHELRTPLNAILGFAQLLSIDRTHPLAGQQEKQVRWILDAGDQLLNLVEDVLDLSKVETGEVSMHIQPCDPAAVLHASLNLVESARQRFQVEITDRLPSPAPLVLADPKRLLQIFVNLLTNGCKYNNPGGHLHVDAHVEDRMLCIDFIDDGIGLAPQDAAELFQAFRRVTAVSAKVEGSGLGLYIVRQLAERMQGSVSVSSELGVGSRFTVKLPLAP